MKAQSLTLSLLNKDTKSKALSWPMSTTYYCMTALNNQSESQIKWPPENNVSTLSLLSINVHVKQILISKKTDHLLI